MNHKILKSMKSLLKIFITTAFFTASLFFISCDDLYGPPKDSVPVFESVSFEPMNFTFGEWITITAHITDPETALTTMFYQIKTNGKTVTSGTIPINEGTDANISYRIFIPLLSNQPDNAPVTISLTANNILKGYSDKEVTGFTGKRPVYSKLYLVTDDNKVVTLNPQSANKEKFEANGLMLDRYLNYRIAEKITEDGDIDYDGVVWNNENGRLTMSHSEGEAAFTFTQADYIESVVFDNVAFSVTVDGAN